MQANEQPRDARLSAAMLGLAARGSAALDAEARADIVAFVQDCRDPDGGFRGRAATRDLYYTLFGIDCLRALGASGDWAATGAYLRGFGDGEGLDFVHLACLARCLARLPDRERVAETARRVLSRLEACRSGDGGYHVMAGVEHGSVYGCFLVLLAYDDWGLPPPDPAALAACIAALRTPDGGFANVPGMRDATTTATAAAALLLGGQARSPVPPDRAGRSGARADAEQDGDRQKAVLRACDSVGQRGPGLADPCAWLLQRACPAGGFKAAASAPAPDLLSTATALFALSALGQPLGRVRQPCRGFVESLWADSGGFLGHAADTAADCEYTFYALLTLGAVA